MENFEFNVEKYIRQNSENLLSFDKEYTNSELAKTIDHTMLKPQATPADVIGICEEAIEHKFASVCVNSCYTSLVANRLKDSGVKTCVVIGFPLGAMSTNSKVAEVNNAISNGADEIDMVINVGMLKAEEYDYVLNDIKAVVDATHTGRAICKVIIETSLLTDVEKVRACFLSKKAKANFVKTSTGFNGGGATLEDVSLMKRVVGDKLQVKASGGVRSREDAVNVLNAGADRIGASAGVKIVTNQIFDGNY